MLLSFFHARVYFNYSTIRLQYGFTQEQLVVGPSKGLECEHKRQHYKMYRKKFFLENVHKFQLEGEGERQDVQLQLYFFLVL